MFQIKLANKKHYKASIGRISFKLPKLQESNGKTQKIRAKKLTKDLNRYKDVNRVLHHQELLFLPKIIWTKLINQYYNNLLVGYFGIDKTKKPINWEYY